MTDLLHRIRTALADRYAIEKEIGSGGMATVYLAEDLRHRRKVAVKVLRPDLAATLGPDRFVREIEVAAGLTHPHVLPLHDSGEADGFLFYVMPYVEGESLRARLSREGELPVGDAVRILREVVDALTSAHRRGVVHRDIKPDNVLFAENHAMVTDFGVAKAVSEATGRQHMTTAGVALGTPAYMSPEQASADPHVDHRADIYAVGALGYELLAGRPPFTGGTAQAVLAAHMTEIPEPVTKHRPSVPPPLSDIILKCLEKKPADRWQSAEELLSRLETLTTPSGGITPTDTRPVSVAPRRTVSQRLGVPLGVAALAVVIIGGWILRGGSEAAPAGEVSSNVVAVLPFSVRGGEQYTYLGEGMVNLLSTALNGAGDMRSVDPRALLGHVSQRDYEAADPNQARRAAVGLGAGLYVQGDILELGERIRIDAALYSTERDAEAVAAGTAEGEESRISELVDDLATQLLAGQRLGPGGRITRLASVTTNSLEALKAYLEGETDFRQGLENRGVEGFQRAVAIDSTFALAYYRMSIAAAWAGRDELAHDALQRATAYKDRLSERDVRLLEALRAFLHGNVDVADSLYRTSVATYPDDVEAWYMLGETLIHFGPFRGQSMTESREPFETLLRFEPDHQSGLFHLAQVALREEQYEELDSLTNRYLRLYPDGGVAPDVLAMRMAAFGDSVAEGDFYARPTTESEMRGDLREVFLFGRDAPTARGIVATRMEQNSSRAFRAFAHAQLAHVEMGSGRWAVAQAQLDSAALLNPELAALHRAYFLLVPYVNGTDAALAAVYDQLERFAAGGESEDLVARYERWYTQGLLAARLGRDADARRHAADLEAQGDPSSYEGTLASDFAVGIRAALASRSAQSSDELAILERATLNKWYGYGGGDALTNRVIQRFRRGQLLQALDRNLEAVQWYGSIADITIEESAYIAPSLINAGEIYEELGDAQSALGEYDLFLKLWENADPEFQPMVDDVRRRVERLTGN